jgi:arabinofuranosyltransferase
MLLATAPVVSGMLIGAYVVWVGGDYMHARMFVPVVFALLLPVMLLPAGRARRAESIGAALLVLWAIFAGFEARTPYQGIAFGPDGITNERSYEVAAYGIANPVTSASRDAGDGAILLPQIKQIDARSQGKRLLVISSGVAANGPLWAVSLNPALPDRSAFFYNNMGITDQVVPRDGTVVDVNGLASPLAGHLLITERGRPGHEKWLPVDWVVAEYGDPALINSLPATQGVDKAGVLAARHALTCGKLKDLMDSVNEPMSLGRFWSNLTGAVSRTSLRVPADPIQAEREFCG